MNLTLTAEPVPLRLAEEGRVYRVGDTRVSLDTVIHAHRSGSTAEEIVRSFDTLKLSDVRTVIAYYLKHQKEVDEYLEKREREAEKIRLRLIAAGMSPANPAELRERLVQRAASFR